MRVSSIFLLLCLLWSRSSAAQVNVNGYDRGKNSCMSLVSERYNILYLNDSNIVDFRSTGYRKDQIILKGDANTTVINKKNGWPIVVPSSETFELSIYEIASDSLIYTEQFIAITKGTLSKIQENPINPGSHCDHIFSYKNENTLFRSRENHLYLRRQHYDDSLISFEVFNGTLLSDDPNKVIIRPGDDILTMVTVYYDGKMILSKQYMVQD